MAGFKIDGRMTVRTLKENFKNEFEGTLRVYNGRELADDNATLASIRKTEDVKTGNYVCRASRTVGKFEKEMMEVFGIRIQIASPDDYVLALDGITLANLKKIKNNSTKDDMEELVSYRRKPKAESEEGADIKYVNIFVSYDAMKAGEFDLHSLLDEYGYESLEEYIDSEGYAEIVQEGDWYLNNVNSVYVAESKDRKEYLIGNPDLKDGITYEDGEYCYEEEVYEIPEEGFSFIQDNSYLFNAFVIEIDADEEFDISEVTITNGGNTLVYKGEEYDAVGSDGDDNGDVTFYEDGEEI